MSGGRGQLVSNINACCAVADILRTTLGPMGMDKLIKSSEKATVSNDGATIIRLLDVVHPAAKVLTEIAQSQDQEVGDGTTSVVLLAAELLLNAKEFVQEGVAPQEIIAGYKTACEAATLKLEDLALNLQGAQPPDLNLSESQVEEFQKNPKRFILQQCAMTALTSKLIENEKIFFADLLVDAFLRYGEDAEATKDCFAIKPLPGGSIRDSFVVQGAAFKKTFSYAGFEAQPKSFLKPKIALLNVELELKTEHISAEVRVDPSQYKAVVDAEWKVLYDKLEKLHSSGANIVLSKQPVGDLATQFCADRGMFCAGRVPSADLERVAAICGGRIQSSLKDLGLCQCAKFEERQIGKERVNFFWSDDSLTNHKELTTLILRGGSEHYTAEAARSLNDAVMVVKNTVKHTEVVAGGGATEMELSRSLKMLSKSKADKSGFFVLAFAKALEAIPQALAVNAGLDATDILNQLRAAHHNGDRHAGVDVMAEGIGDSLRNFVWEPLASKRNILRSATEAACLVLSVDETIKVPHSQAAPAQGAMPMGRGMPMMR